MGVWVREVPYSVMSASKGTPPLWEDSSLVGLEQGPLNVEHKPSSWAGPQLFPEQLSAAPPGVSAFLSSSLHAACQVKRKVRSEVL